MHDTDRHIRLVSATVGASAQPAADPELVEMLAAYAHDAWAQWMQYLFEQARANRDGSVTIPDHLVERWSRQLATAYANLPDHERESDRREARRIIDRLGAYARQGQP